MEVELTKKEGLSGWFDIEGGGRVNVKLLDVDEMKAIRAACVKTVAEYPYLDVDPGDPKKGKAYKRFESEKLDGELLMEMINDKSIIGWDAMVDSKTKSPIEVTPENKKILMFPGVCPKFAEAVEAARVALKKAEEEKAAAELKNS